MPGGGQGAPSLGTAPDSSGSVLLGWVSPSTTPRAGLCAGATGSSPRSCAWQSPAGRCPLSTLVTKEWNLAQPVQGQTFASSQEQRGSDQALWAAEAVQPSPGPQAWALLRGKHSPQAGIRLPDAPLKQPKVSGGKRGTNLPEPKGSLLPW